MASYQIKWKASATKELRKLPRQVIPPILAAINDLSNNPFPHGMRKMVDSEQSYRIRVGDYRVIYDVIKNELIIQILRVRHRKDAYR